jgi:glutaredoxin-like protein
MPIMTDPKIIVYGADWCGDCLRAKRFLNQFNIQYSWINIDRDELGEEFVLKVNKGMRSIPTIIFEDGSILVEPSNLKLAQKLGITIEQ